MNGFGPVTKLVAAVLLLVYPTSSLAYSLPLGSMIPQTQTESTDKSSTADDEPEEAEVAECVRSKDLGHAAADSLVSTGNWIIGGFFSGVLLGVVGATALGLTGKYATNPQPAEIPPGLDPNCYAEGYKNKGTGKKGWAAFGGGLLGTGVFVMVYLISQGSTD